jgi:translation initiation factor 1
MQLNLTGSNLETIEFNQKTSKIHFRIQQNGKRKLTIIQGLDNDLDHKRIMKAMKKVFNCNGAFVVDEEYGEIIQLQGDQREACIEWLITQEILTETDRKERVVVHGI